MIEGELCESMECSGKNKGQKRVKEKKEKKWYHNIFTINFKW